MSDIFVDKDKCPVCGGEMGCIDPNKFYDFAYCTKNDCYTIDEGIVYFFDERIIYFTLFKKEDQVGILERIAYWKENDRYLMKILTMESVKK